MCLVSSFSFLSAHVCTCCSDALLQPAWGCSSFSFTLKGKLTWEHFRGASARKATLSITLRERQWRRFPGEPCGKTGYAWWSRGLLLKQVHQQLPNVQRKQPWLPSEVKEWLPSFFPKWRLSRSDSVCSSEPQVLSWLTVPFLTGLDKMLLKVLLESIPVRMGLWRLRWVAYMLWNLMSSLEGGAILSGRWTDPLPWWRGFQYGLHRHNSQGVNCGPWKVARTFCPIYLIF